MRILARLLASLVGTAGLATAAIGPAAAHDADRSPIDHVVILMQENRSFDSYFAQLHFEGQPRTAPEPREASNPNPLNPEAPYPRVRELRTLMSEFGLDATPIFMAGGVWYLREWTDWIDNPELGPISFQFGTRPLLTQESPISDAWKRKLLTLEEGDVYLNRFSPTGFYSSAVRNAFLNDLSVRNEQQVAYTVEPVGDHLAPLQVGARGRLVYLTPHDRDRAQGWIGQGFTEALRTPDSTLVFVTPQKALEIRTDQINCMGCLSACQFSNWAQNEAGSTGKKADPRSFCIQKTLQAISHSDDVEFQLMFAGHNAYRFAGDPFYANGYVPTVRELVARLETGN